MDETVLCCIVEVLLPGPVVLFSACFYLPKCVYFCAVFFDIFDVVWFRVNVDKILGRSQHVLPAICDSLR